jgi:hypothetical protein
MNIELDFFIFLESLNLNIPIAYPAVKFTPPETGIWLETKILRNTGIDNGLSDVSTKVEQGIFQINVCLRPNQGIITLTNYANGLIGQIPKGLNIGGVKVIRQPYMMQPIYVDDRVILPITIEYSQ